MRISSALSKPKMKDLNLYCKGIRSVTKNKVTEAKKVSTTSTVLKIKMIETHHGNEDDYAELVN